MRALCIASFFPLFPTPAQRVRYRGGWPHDAMNITATRMGFCVVLLFVAFAVAASAAASAKDSVVEETKTCLTIIGYSSCEQFKVASCLADEWLRWASASGALFFPQPSLRLVGGTRDDFYRRWAQLRAQLPRIRYVRRESPAVLLGCAEDATRQFIGDLDHFQEWLRKWGAPIAPACLELALPNHSAEATGVKAPRVA